MYFKIFRERGRRKELNKGDKDGTRRWRKRKIL